MDPDALTHDLLIQSAAAARGKPAGKTRSFRAKLLGYAVANDWLVRNGATSARIRPAILRLAGPEQALRAVLANLRSGHPAALVPTALAGSTADPRADGELELLKTAGYRVLTQRLLGDPRGPLTQVTCYLPDLLTLRPRQIDPAAVAFVAPCPTWWVEREAAALDPALAADVLAHLVELGQLGRPRAARLARDPAAARRAVPQAVQVLAYLRARSRSPVPATPAFAVQVLLAGLEARLLTQAHALAPGRREATLDRDTPAAWACDPARPGFAATALAAAGEEPPVACQTTQAALDAFFAREVAVYFQAQQRLAAAADPRPAAA